MASAVLVLFLWFVFCFPLLGFLVVLCMPYPPRARALPRRVSQADLDEAHRRQACEEGR